MAPAQSLQLHAQSAYCDDRVMAARQTCLNNDQKSRRTKNEILAGQSEQCSYLVAVSELDSAPQVSKAMCPNLREDSSHQVPEPVRHYLRKSTRHLEAVTPNEWGFDQHCELMTPTAEVQRPLLYCYRRRTPRTHEPTLENP